MRAPGMVRHQALAGSPVLVSRAIQGL